MKKQFLYAENFASASMEQMFTGEKLKNASTLTANYFANALLINNGKSGFGIKPLPWQAQLTCFKDAVVIDADNNNKPDIF